jgi:hypothetical protein
MTRILLIAGPVRPAAPAGHHDYVAGCRLLADLLNRLAGVQAQVAPRGWPDDPAALRHADAIVCYEGGNGKQGFLRAPARLAEMRTAWARGAGLVLLHQAVALPAHHEALAADVVGGRYVVGDSKRGHWLARHERFPQHPVTRAVTPWRHRDGWLNGFCFDEPERVTPLLWAKRLGGGRDPAGAVSWAYQRSDGGRTFAFTGLDNHRAWFHPGLRRLVANAALWTGGYEPPEDGGWTGMDATRLDAYRTPREGGWLRRLPRKVGRKLRGRRKW